MSRMDRRNFLRSTGAGAVALGVGLPMLAAACGDDSESSGSSSGGKDLGKVTVQLNWIKNVQFAGPYIAESEGYYKKNGFSSSEILTGGPDVVVEPLVVSGKVTYSLTAPEFAADAIKEGADLMVIGALFQNNPFGVMSLAKNPIRSPKDMIGKRIGVQAVNESLWQALLKINNIKESDVKKIPAQFDPAPLVNGEADGWFSFVTNEPNILRAEGKDVVDFSLSDFGFKSFQQILIVNGKTLKEDRAKLVAGLKSEIMGWQRNIKEPALGVKLAVEVYGKDLKLSAKASELENKSQIERMIDTGNAKGRPFWMADADIDNTVKTMSDIGHGALQKKHFDTSLLQEIYKDGNDLLK
jgi:ABC-type nitrate/sulfonate/bicarbonate transport system substrate-binding protein